MTAEVSVPSTVRRNHSQHILVALALTAICLVSYTVVDYGNNLGIDDWVHFYKSYLLHTPDYSNRPLALLALVGLSPILKGDYFTYHFISCATYSLAAFLIYLLVWRLDQTQSLFAFACGAATAIFRVNDTWFLLSFIYAVDILSNLIVVLLALNVYAIYLNHLVQGGRSAWVLLVVSIGLSGLAVFIREGSIPLLLGLPLLLSLSKPVSVKSLASYGVWSLAVVVFSLRYVLPVFGVGPATYGSVLFQDFDPVRIFWASRGQFEFAFPLIIQTPVIQTEVPTLYQNGLAVAATLAIIAVSFVLLGHQLWDKTAEKSFRQGTWDSIKSIAVALVAAWLGFAAFLPTNFADSRIRTHILSIPGEAIVAVSTVWLLSYLSRSINWRWVIRLVGVCWIAIYSVSMLGKLQTELYSFDATWENTASFMRSLAHLAPAVKSPTLFIYVENPDTEETPFVSGFSFQYAVRYFYGESATGLVPSDSILGKWSVSDAGIFMEEAMIKDPNTYGWNEIIVFTRESSGRLVILEMLPERFLTSYRQGLYRPLARIVPAFVSTRIQETFPILSGPNWSAENYLLQNH